MRIFRKIVPAVCIMIALTQNVYADIGMTYKSLSESYGENAQDYMIKTQMNENAMINELHCHAVDAIIGGSTSNVRNLPDKYSDLLASLKPNTPVKIWGITENDWCKIYAVTEDKVPVFGYISSELLALPAAEQGE